MQYKHLTPYKRPSNYMGATWFGYFDVAGRNRDSDVLTNSNFECWVDFLINLLGPADTEIGTETEPQSRSTFGDEESDAIYNWTICRESHWACGYIEIIRVHESVGHDKLAAIDAQLARLDDYPVFNEDHFSQAEDAERQSSWDSDCKRLWHNWLENHIGEARFELIASVYKDEIEELLRRAFDIVCMNSGNYWADPDEGYDIEQLVHDSDHRPDDRMSRLIENLYAAEAANVVTE